MNPAYRPDSSYGLNQHITVVQVVQDWAPGARNANHAMNQPHLYSMMEGENMLRLFDGRSERFTANQAGVMAVGHSGYMENSESTANRLFFTWAVYLGCDPWSAQHRACNGRYHDDRRAR